MPIITLEQTVDADVERGGDFSLFTRTADIAAAHSERLCIAVERRSDLAAEYFYALEYFPAEPAETPVYRGKKPSQRPAGCGKHEHQH